MTLHAILSPSYTVTIPATIHHNSSRFEPDGKIGMRRDGKKENQESIRCLMMLLRCLHDSSTDPLRLMTTELRFTRVALRMVTIRYGASTIQAGSATVASRPATNVHDLVVVMRQSWGGGGGGGYSHFFFIRRLGPSSTVHPEKISGISSTPKKIEILAITKKSPLTLKKTLKCIKLTPKYSPIL